MPGVADNTLHCGQCGYDVRGLPTLVCPECGHELSQAGIQMPSEPDSSELIETGLMYTLIGGSSGFVITAIMLMALPDVARGLQSVLPEISLLLLFLPGAAAGGGLAYVRWRNARARWRRAYFHALKSWDRIRESDPVD